MLIDDGSSLRSSRCCWRRSFFQVSHGRSSIFFRYPTDDRRDVVGEEDGATASTAKMSKINIVKAMKNEMERVANQVDDSMGALFYHGICFVVGFFV